ncbi:hypothetical protein GCM10017600_53710 [Streptosporangium carneum]|uniref:Uncharacterized protein n=1 Tax=Streptosporangium carneum TaxID=47481 RepID=A0A9W6I6A6_9ACTN|nr:hypothetical protein GCM10017600_53710 [Streptosporangium carneum]
MWTGPQAACRTAPGGAGQGRAGPGGAGREGRVVDLGRAAGQESGRPPNRDPGPGSGRPVRRDRPHAAPGDTGRFSMNVREKFEAGDTAGRDFRRLSLSEFARKYGFPL